MESLVISKVFFDVRHDSDALYSLHGISVGGIEDLQLMELACRAGHDKRYVSSLSKCIERDAAISPAEKQAWKAVKDKGKKLFDPARGGSYAVSDQRPLSPEVERYSVQDVVHMPDLYKKYDGKLTRKWRRKVQAERIVLSQSVDFVGGKYLGKGPKSWNPVAPKRGKQRRGAHHAAEPREQPDHDGLEYMAPDSDRLVEEEMEEYLDELDMPAWG